MRFTAPVTYLAVDSSHTHLAAGSCDFSIKVLELGDSPRVVTLHGHEAPVLCARFDPRGEYLVCGWIQPHWDDNGLLVVLSSACDRVYEEHVAPKSKVRGGGHWGHSGEGGSLGKFLERGGGGGGGGGQWGNPRVPTVETLVCVHSLCRPLPAVMEVFEYGL